MDILKTREFLEFGFNVITCPVCGEETLDNHFVCPHCGWEHDGTVKSPEQFSTANQSTIEDYKNEESKNSL